jgi:hypothetical protein
MRSSFVFLLALCQPGPSLASVPVLFRLYAEFQSEPPAAVWKAIQDEVEGVLRPIGWSIDWDTISGATGQMSISLAVARFKGECKIGGGVSEPAESMALGATHVSGEDVLPFTVIDCDAIRNFLSPLLIPLDPRKQEFTFGRAVGRVLAHELYHVITKSKGHGRKGLGRAGLTREELTQPYLQFSSDDVLKLRTRLLPLVLQSTDWSARPELARGLSLFTTSGCRGCHGPAVEGTSWGPPLDKPAPSLDSIVLVTWIRSSISKMSKQAKSLHLPFLRLSGTEYEALASYLNHLFRSERAAIATHAPIAQ